MLELRELSYSKSIAFVKDYIRGSLHFGHILNDNLKFDGGTFYMIVPKSLDDEIVREF